MAVVEEGSGGSRSPSRPKRDRGLSRWDDQDVAPRAPVGAISRPAPTRPQSYDSSRLQKLTPYAIPTQEERPVATSADATASSLSFTANRPLNVAVPTMEKYNTIDGEQRTETVEHPGKEKTRRTLELSWDDYEKLSDAKRAAVDFNTLLVQAREKDLNADYKPTAGQQEKFQAEAEKMFGEGHGSETFAPETLAVLKDIDFKTSGNEDLDNFLGLKDAISAKELKDFSFDKELLSPQRAPEPQADLLKAISPGGAGGLETEQRVGVYTQNLQEAMARAGDVLQSWRASGAQSRNDEVLALGGTFNEVNRAPGYGDKPPFVDADADGIADKNNLDGFLQDALASLSNPKMDPQVTFDALSGSLRGDETTKAMQYFDEQTRTAIQSGTGVLGISGNTRNPVEIRKLLGLDGGN